MRRTLLPQRLLVLAAGVLLAALLTVAVQATGLRAARSAAASLHITLSIVGASDLHGYFMPRSLAWRQQRVRGIREQPARCPARRCEPCCCSMLATRFQGGVESDLSEGAGR